MRFSAAVFNPENEKSSGLPLSFVCGSGYFSASPVCACGRAPRRPGRACRARAPPCQSTRRRVIARRAEDAELRIVLHVDDHAVPAGHDETEKRRLQLRIGQIVCRNVSPDVMHRHERHAEPQRREFREVHPDKHRADQPRRIRHGHGAESPRVSCACASA